MMDILVTLQRMKDICPLDCIVSIESGARPNAIDLRWRIFLGREMYGLCRTISEVEIVNAADELSYVTMCIESCGEEIKATLGKHKIHGKD